MDPAVLEAAKEAEMSEPLFTDLPGGSNMFVVTNCVMDVAVSDLSKADEVKTLVKDIWDIRQSKLRKVVDSFVLSGSLRATLNHVQLIELNSVRPLLPHTLDQILRLEMAGLEPRRQRASSSLVNSSGATAGDRSMLLGASTMY